MSQTITAGSAEYNDLASDKSDLSPEGIRALNQVLEHGPSRVSVWKKSTHESIRATFDISDSVAFRERNLPDGFEIVESRVSTIGSGTRYEIRLRRWR